MIKGVYEAPAAEAVAVEMERNNLSFTKASRVSYGTANDGVDSNQLDDDGNWAWN